MAANLSHHDAVASCTMPWRPKCGLGRWPAEHTNLPYILMQFEVLSLSISKPIKSVSAITNVLASAPVDCCARKLPWASSLPFPGCDPGPPGTGLLSSPPSRLLFVQSFESSTPPEEAMASKSIHTESVPVSIISE